MSTFNMMITRCYIISLVSTRKHYILLAWWPIKGPLLKLIRNQVSLP